MRPAGARVPFLALGMIALAAGTWAGVLRLGFPWTTVHRDLPLAHGPLMVSGFLGTVIGLERAVALGRPWAYAAPALSGAGGLLLALGAAGRAGAVLMTAASALVVAVFALAVRRERALHAATMGLGAACWLVGNVLLVCGWPIMRLVLWWSGFLVFTIAGERLELARLLRPAPARRAAFLAASGFLLAGLILETHAFGSGVRVAGLGMLGLAGWLLVHDVARRTVRGRGLPRFVAVALLSGYAWLAAAGALALWQGLLFPGPAYDAALHALFLGFVFTMIFGHAPIIFPAVLRVPICYRRAFYAHLVLLHASLVVRVAADLAAWPDARRWASLANVAALVLFLVNTVRSVGRSGAPAADA